MIWKPATEVPKNGSYKLFRIPLEEYEGYRYKLLTHEPFTNVWLSEDGQPYDVVGDGADWLDPDDISAVKVVSAAFDRFLELYKNHPDYNDHEYNQQAVNESMQCVVDELKVDQFRERES